jgi:amino acid permease
MGIGERLMGNSNKENDIVPIVGNDAGDDDPIVVLGDCEGNIDGEPLSMRGRHTSNVFTRLAASVIPRGGVASSCFNLCCSTLGASTIALPGAFKACGLALGPVLLVLFAACTVFSIRLLCITAELSGHDSYEQMARHLVGRFFDHLSTFVMIIFCWGCGVSYICATSDLVQPLLEGHVPDFWVSEWGVRLITVSFWCVTMLPLALMREINSLRYVSFFGVMAIVYFIIVMVAHSATHGMKDGGFRDVAVFGNGGSTLVGVGLIMFTFCCQPNVLEVYSELRVRTVKHMTKIGSIAMGISTTLYLIAGLFGYVDFGPRVHGTVLDNYDLHDSPALYVAYACLAIKLTAAHTLCIAPTRDSILYELRLGTYHTAKPTYRMIISALLSCSALLVALFIPSLQLLFGFLGALCGSLLGFVFPAVFALRTQGWREQATPLDRVGTYALLAIGVVVFLFGTAASIYEAVNP